MIGTSVINLLLSICLGNIWGVFGIQAANVIARILTNVWYEPFALFKFGFHRSPSIYAKKYFLYFLVEIVTCCVCMLFCSAVNISVIVDPFIKIVICSIIPNTMFYFAFKNKKEFRLLSDKAHTIRDMLLKISRRLLNE